ncbi:MAG: carbohydrate-binding protein [Fibrobacter sp.]|nr:carbohydrate-binding protein [Fibrobacter sp.]
MGISKFSAFHSALALGFGVFAANAFADNPLVSYHYLADPAAFVMDSTFYIIADTDDESGDDGYTIKSYYAFSSEDMQNWTDYGMIFSAGREVSYATGAWAPGAVAKDGQIYIVYPNGASGIGMLTASNIAGPYTDPVGKLLIGGWGTSAGSVDCDGIAWCFDPSIFIDDDGSAYITYGGGSSSTRDYGNNFDLYKLSDLTSSKVALNVSSKVAIQGAQKSFEASYIHKYNGKYYLTYNDQQQHISYAISNSISGPYTYMGTFMENPNINGKNINAYNNNHHGIAEFQGHWYVAYHDRRLAQASEHPASLGKANPEPAYHRSLSIDEFTYSGEKMNSLTFTNEGPKQLKNFNPYKAYPALTSSKQRNVRSRSDYVKGQPISHVLTPLASKESWLRISGVDFGSGASSFIVKAASVASGNQIEIHSGSVDGTLAGTCELPKTANWQTYAETECAVENLSGVVDYVFLVFKGTADSTMGILQWEFASKPLEPQTAYNNEAQTIPGKIEMENYDLGGANNAYRDSDSKNEGGVYREDGVDVVELDDSGYAIGYTLVGEWAEYTVNVSKTANYLPKVHYATGLASSSIQLYLDGELLVDTLDLPQTAEDSWSVYEDVSADSVALSAGEHVLKVLITGSYVNLDYIEFLSADSDLTQISNRMDLNVKTSNAVYDVYDLQGNLLKSVNSRGFSSVEQILKQSLVRNGVYLIRNRSNGASKKLRVIQ